MDPDGLIDSNWDEVCENFDDMNLREELLRGIYAYGFEKPSAIQQRAIGMYIRNSLNFTKEKNNIFICKLENSSLPPEV